MVQGVCGCQKCTGPKGGSCVVSFPFLTNTETSKIRPDACFARKLHIQLGVQVESEGSSTSVGKVGVYEPSTKKRTRLLETFFYVSNLA